MAVDIGAELTAVLLDGRHISGRLTFGDIARAELMTHVNFMDRFRAQSGISLSDLAALTFQVAKRTGQFSESWDQWLLQLDSFQMPEDEPPSANGSDAAQTLDPTQVAVLEGS
jgi:hypothetical protein